ncbi:hypothetical protein RFI_32720 [Reticulomyxa filosa]|uniref:Pop1 N-terminal domain-containing protein n=1 Tax=Reticulomyxa filosa TaxID=46433 RepID=X6LVB9_RETFI|nr:hypothetical protein RFI_32720 [Reticulomyxa filosa]|eukprot:ETO04675.1 hypothetical protein RFI_32720 [Reticulomyxa filosa]
MNKALTDVFLTEHKANESKQDAGNVKSLNSKYEAIDSGEIFTNRTMEARALLNDFARKIKVPGAGIATGRHRRRRGRSHFTSTRKRKKKKEQSKSQQSVTKEKKILLRYQKRRPFSLLLQRLPSRNVPIDPAAAQVNSNTKANKNRWLPTHLWYAKRAQMQPLWGISIASTMSQTRKPKFHRSVARFYQNYCILHDASYAYRLIAVQTQKAEHIDQSRILQLCKNYIAPFQWEQWLRNDAFLQGRLEMSFFLFQSQTKYPFGFITCVKMSWNYSWSNDSERVLWIWAHSSVYNLDW